MHVLHNWLILCMINIYNKLNMLIIVGYIYILNNIERKYKACVSRENKV